MGYPESAQPTALPLPDYIQSNPFDCFIWQDHYGKSNKFVNMLTEKHMGFSYSYNNVRRSRKNFLKPSLPTNLKVIEERSSQSDLHCVFALTEADNANFGYPS